MQHDGIFQYGYHISQIKFLLTVDMLWYFVCCHYPFVLPQLYFNLFSAKETLKKFTLNIVIVSNQASIHARYNLCNLLLNCPLIITVGFKYLDLRVHCPLSLWCFAALLLPTDPNSFMIYIEIMTNDSPKSCFDIISFENQIQCNIAKLILAVT